MYEISIPHNFSLSQPLAKVFLNNMLAVQNYTKKLTN